MKIKKAINRIIVCLVVMSFTAGLVLLMPMTAKANTVTRTSALSLQAGVNQSGTGWSWNGTTLTLTMTNVTFIFTGTSGGGWAINMPAGSTVNLNGTNYIDTRGQTYNVTFGASGGTATPATWTINGPGSLDIYAGTSSNNLLPMYAHAPITIRNNANITIQGNNTSGSITGSYGICADGGGIIIENSTVNVAAGSGTYSSYGINASSVSINNSTVTATAASGSTESHGIHAGSGGLTISSNSTVIARGGTAATSHGLNSSSITINNTGGSVTAQGNTSALSRAPASFPPLYRATWSTNFNGTSASSGTSYIYNSGHRYVQIRPAYSITYNGNQSNGGTVPTDSLSPYAHNSTVTVLGAGTMTRTGYTFNGWNTIANGSGTNRSVNSTFTITANATLFAQWTANTYTVTLNHQGGSGGVASLTATYDSSTLTGSWTAPTAPSTNYTFDGYWTTAAGSAGSRVINTNGTLVANVAGYTDASGRWISASNQTLHARWNQSVTLNHQTGTGVSPVTMTRNASTIGGWTAPTRANYTFDGYWTDAVGGTQIINASGALVANVTNFTGAGGIWTRSTTTALTLHAQWTQTVTLNHQGGTSTFNSFAVRSNSTSAPGWVAPTAPSSNYVFDGYWTAAAGSAGDRVINPNGTFVANVTNFTGAGGAWTRTTAGPTLHARYNQTVTLNRQGGTTGAISVTMTRNASTIGGWTAPTRANYTFNGYFTEAVGGTQVINTSGALVANVTNFTGAGGIWTRSTTTALTLHAQWIADTYTVTLDRQGGTTGSTSFTTTFESSIHNASMPTRTGYDFMGYFTAVTGGSQVIDASGVLVANVSGYTGAGGIWTRTGATTLYAQWTAHTFEITLNYNDGTDRKWSIIATFGAAMPEIIPPTRVNNNFLGFFSTAETGGTKYYNADGSSARNWDLLSNINLYARWESTRNFVVDNQTDGNFGISGSGNDELFDSFNITDDDIVTVTLTVATLDVPSDPDQFAPGIGEILDGAKGRALQFFDITVKKQINDTPPIRLSELPAAVQVVINLSPELSGRTGYTVYRFHDNEVQRIGLDTDDSEYFTVSRGTGTNGVDQIIINTKKFSTYAVVENTVTINNTNIPENFDVQARIIDDSIVIYRIDIVWGDMKFEFHTDMDGSGEKLGWLASDFQNGNNQITVYNRSNADVEVSFAVTNSLGISDMDIFDENNTPAIGMKLGKVPNSGATPPNLEVFLLFEDEPDITQLEENTWSKIGVITITIKPDD